jgi:lipoprotein-anchoring transpeptidase ErfK/SrfK
MQDRAPIEETESTETIAPELQRQVVNYATPASAGTIIIDTAHTYLYFVLGDGKAIRYGIGVGRDGFTWSGAQTVTRMAEWPDWTPPREMIERQPYLPRWMAGGKGNPVGPAPSTSAARFTGSTGRTLQRRSVPGFRAGASD